jgi:hypothetical protein
MSTHDVIYVDTETTGLDPDRHPIWEVGVIYWDHTYRIMVTHREAGRTVPVANVGRWMRSRWLLPVNLQTADARALDIGHFHERHPQGYRFERTPHDSAWEHNVTSPEVFAREFAALSWGKHIAGAVPSFDEERLRGMIRGYSHVPGWHYHIITVEVLALGYLRGLTVGREQDDHEAFYRKLPWSSHDMSRAVGIEPPTKEDEHTAIGDATWVRRLHWKIMGYTDAEMV